MTIEERYEEFLRRVNEVARELKLEIEFTTQTQGHDWMQYQAPCAEIVCYDDTAEFPRYLCVDGSTDIGYVRCVKLN